MRRKLLVSGAAVVILGGAVAGVVLGLGSDGKGRAATPAFPPATAKVTRTTLEETKTVSGTLSYGRTAAVRAVKGGTVTWLAPVGSTISRGKPLFKLDERPDAVLYGSLPLYRTLREGRNGRDVRELEQNLADLGYMRFRVDDTYTAATARAVRRWQKDLGAPETGAVGPGQAVFTQGPVRVAEQIAPVGDLTVGGTDPSNHPLLTYSGTTRQVTAKLEVTDQSLAAKGRTVTVKVPGLPAVKGTISRVDSVVAPQGGAPTEGGPPAEGGASEGATSAIPNVSIDVTVTIADQKALGSLDAAPADIELVSNKREGVLAVPVAALLAVPQGGFGVQVVDGDRTRIVAVKTGMCAAGQVEVSGQGISQGVSVGVPK
jgi:peptidoglycan hydrolase-like protein with peptidoglycan-binding domain